MEFKWSTIISQKVNIYVINALERNVRFKVIVLQNIRGNSDSRVIPNPYDLTHTHIYLFIFILEKYIPATLFPYNDIELRCQALN